MSIVVFLAGLVLGGLLNIMVIRLPREQRLLGWPRCTRTGERLTLWQLIPVLGWLVQRGRARNGRPLGWIYPLVELLTACVVLLLYRRYGFSASFGYLVFVCAVLIVTGAIDFLYRYIYTLAILLPALIVVLAGPALGQLSLLASLLGALIAGGIFLLLYMLARLLFPAHAAPFGLGDVYLAMFIGGAVGLLNLGPALIYGILLAGAVAASYVVADKLLRWPKVPRYISYGTYLCLGTIAYVLIWGLDSAAGGS
jgi:leader peptidase (prepilin peptidase)/N-methyltransferase